MLCGEAKLIFAKKRNPASDQWQHNLGLGATATIETNEKLKAKLVPLAKKTMTALTLEFASVDIVSSEQGLKVLEVNSGVMMEHFSQESAENYQLAKNIYREAVLKMFSEIKK
jgi:ribosomal protein S6--L-glutamate ligase